MPGSDIPAERAAEITAFVEIEASPPPGQPAAHLIFGTNQAEPAVIPADRYHDGLAPLIIVTGGVNRGYTPGDWLARGSPTANPRVRIAAARPRRTGKIIPEMRNGGIGIRENFS
jgi:hypothetical protein